MKDWLCRQGQYPETKLVLLGLLAALIFGAAAALGFYGTPAPAGAHPPSEDEPWTVGCYDGTHQYRQEVDDGHHDVTYGGTTYRGWRCDDLPVRPFDGGTEPPSEYAHANRGVSHLSHHCPSTWLSNGVWVADEDAHGGIRPVWHERHHTWVEHGQRWGYDPYALPAGFDEPPFQWFGRTGYRPSFEANFKSQEGVERRYGWDSFSLKLINDVFHLSSLDERPDEAGQEVGSHSYLPHQHGGCRISGYYLGRWYPLEAFNQWIYPWWIEWLYVHDADYYVRNRTKREWGY